MKLYAAYGSNINLEQMAGRCPGAVPVGKGMLVDYQLLFRGNARGYGVATVEPMKGRRVPILLWAITEACECALDRYEGFPYLYRKELLTVDSIAWMPGPQGLPVDCCRAEAMIYIMNTGVLTGPSDGYLGGIRAGYQAVGFNPRYLSEAVRKTARMGG